MRISNRSVAGCLLATSLLLSAPLVQGTAVAGPLFSPSWVTAVQAYIANQYDAQDDYWLALAGSNLLPDAEDRAEAVAEAKAEFEENKQNAVEVFLARVDLCKALNEFRYHVVINPAHFHTAAGAAAAPNMMWPLVPGIILTYEGETEDGDEVIVVEVTDDTREILGVECTVVRDRVWLDGELIEDTLDWYAQDTNGNVWYFGEQSLEYENDKIVSVDGSWEAGEDGAIPGIVMQATPVAGSFYRQEFFLDEAEDAAEVVALNQTVETAYGTFTGCVQTRDFTPLEPDANEFKYYAEGIGMVLEVKPDTGETVELVDVVHP
jgi:hypothetical protein